MFKEFFEDLKNYTADRFTNPFLGTVLCVWIIRNFEFLFALFNFQDGVTLTQKVDYIRRYFYIHDWLDLLCTVGYAFLIMSISMCFMLISKFLTNIYKFSINQVNKRTDKGEVVSREELNKEKSRSNALRVENDGYKQRIDVIETSLKDQLDRYNTLDNQFKDQSSENQKLRIERDTAVNKLFTEIEQHRITNSKLKDLKITQLFEGELGEQFSVLRIEYARNAFYDQTLMPNTDIIEGIYKRIDEYKETLENKEDPNIDESRFLKQIYPSLLYIDYYAFRSHIYQSNSDTISYSHVYLFVELGLINKNSVKKINELFVSLNELEFTEYGNKLYYIMVN